MTTYKITPANSSEPAYEVEAEKLEIDTTSGRHLLRDADNNLVASILNASVVRLPVADA